MNKGQIVLFAWVVFKHRLDCTPINYYGVLIPGILPLLSIYLFWQYKPPVVAIPYLKEDTNYILIFFSKYYKSEAENFPEIKEHFFLLRLLFSRICLTELQMHQNASACMERD